VKDEKQDRRKLCIAATVSECAIEKHVSFIRNFDHLVTLCEGFEDWYNIWRPHMTLDGFHPDDVYYDRKPEKPDHDSKTVPSNIEQHLFQETRVAGYRLKAVA